MSDVATMKLVVFCWDYCHMISTGLSLESVQKLQLVQVAVVRWLTEADYKENRNSFVKTSPRTVGLFLNAFQSADYGPQSPKLFGSRLSEELHLPT